MTATDRDALRELAARASKLPWTPGDPNNANHVFIAEWCNRATEVLDDLDAAERVIEMARRFADRFDVAFGIALAAWDARGRR